MPSWYCDIVSGRAYSVWPPRSWSVTSPVIPDSKSKFGEMPYLESHLASQHAIALCEHGASVEENEGDEIDGEPVLLLLGPDQRLELRQDGLGPRAQKFLAEHNSDLRKEVVSDDDAAAGALRRAGYGGFPEGLVEPVVDDDVELAVAVDGRDP